MLPFTLIWNLYYMPKEVEVSHFFLSNSLKLYTNKALAFFFFLKLFKIVMFTLFPFFLVSIIETNILFSFGSWQWTSMGRRSTKPTPFLLICKVTIRRPSPMTEILKIGEFYIFVIDFDVLDNWGLGPSPKDPVKS